MITLAPLRCDNPGPCVFAAAWRTGHVFVEWLAAFFARRQRHTPFSCHEKRRGGDGPSNMRELGDFAVSLSFLTRKGAWREICPMTAFLVVPMRFAICVALMPVFASLNASARLDWFH